MPYDIAARLRLNGQQFEADAKSAFSAFSRDATDTASQAQRAFERSFSEIQSIAKTALAAPRTAGGSLDIDVTGRRASADAAQQEAIALRELATAAERAATSTGDTSAATRLYVAAAQAAATEGEANARSLRQQVEAIETLQAELNRSASGVIVLADANAKGGVSAGAHRAGLQQLGFQLGDFSTQVSGGTSAFVAFAQQAGQAIGAVQLMAGEGTKLASFLGGPLGIAFQAVIPLAAIFAGKLLDTSDAAKEAKKATEEFARRQLDISNFIDRATGAITEQNRTLIQNAILKRQSAIDDNAAKLREKSGEAFGAARKAQGDDTPIYTAGGVTQPRVDPSIRAVITAANGDVVKLDAGLQALVRRRPDLRATVQTVSDAAAQAVTLSRENARLAGEVDQLTGKTRAQAGATAGLIEKQVALATATTPLERARAKLALVQEQGAAAEKAGGKALEQYRANLTTASQAVNAAEAADKAASAAKRDARHETVEHNKEVRAAEKAQRDLANTLDDITRRFDPATAAANDYAKTLRDIADLSAGGKISPIQSSLYQYRADLDRGSKTADTVMSGISGAIDPLVQSMADAIGPNRKFAKDLEDRFTAAGAGAGVAAADALGRVLGVKLNGALGSLGNLKIGGTEGQKLFSEGIKEAVSPLKDVFNVSLGKNGSLAKTLGSLAGYAGIGSAAGGAFGSIAGGKQSALGSSIGGALGGEAGKLLGKELGSQLGKLASFAGPIGSIVGGIAGSILPGLFAKVKKGTATLGSVDGGIGVTSTAGNSASRIANASALGGSVGTQLQQIADQLGGSLGGSISVSIGQRDKKFVVDTTGSGRTKGYGTTKYSDEQSAIAAAVEDALKDGVVTGISAASQKILASGQDLSKAITKAGLIEAVPKQLKAILDPVGAALDELATNQAKVTAALKEGGATADQFAEAQKLFDLQTQSVKANTASASQALKDFAQSLKVGSASPLSLRDQEGAAKTALQPFLDDIAAGRTINQDKYQSAAQSYLDVERQLYGSTQQFFDAFQSIQAATEKAIASVDNASAINAAEKTAAATQASSEILAQQTGLLVSIRDGIAALGGGSSGTTLAGRNYVARA